MPVFETTTRIDADPKEVYDWHLRPGAFARLSPPWERARVIEDVPFDKDARMSVIRMQKGPFSFMWHSLLWEFMDGQSFTDEQLEGPFSKWRHHHQFLPDGEGGTIIKDSVEYKPPLESIGRPLLGWYFRSTLERLFRHRARRLENDFALHRGVKDQGPKRVIVSGASGVVGAQLTAFLQTGGHEVTRLVRRSAEPCSGEIEWDPARGRLEAEDLEGADTVIHLSGENLTNSRWSESKKEAIYNSRVDSTRLIAEKMASLKDPPGTLITASAVGYYGPCASDVTCGEDREAGDDFLARVCRDWENAAGPAEEAGVKVIKLRLGVALSSSGGALAQMVPLFRLGMGAAAGHGRQVISWVSLDDVIGAIHHALFSESLSGPVNVVSPNPVTNEEFSRTLARVMKKPLFLRVPPAAIRAVYGEMGQTLLLAGAKVTPRALLDSGYTFIHPHLEQGIRDELGTWED